MIQKVLQLILKEGISDKNQIARHAGIQVETLDDIIRLLMERGYLRTEENGCDVEPSCSGCHSTADCEIITNTGLVFYVTEKGKKYANKVGGESS
ncbi:MAG: FeoC-like transcriptional regulator [Candidatus Thorarchaeota archaeon SMTZ1-45]|nr:MAG: hypothetical protein AM325_06515 [Candidatus Thorarchaeota archaeon SMTZ1-45]